MNPQIVFCPFVSRSKFAEMVGITEDTLEALIRRGRIPCIKLGRRSFVDLRVWLSSDKSVLAPSALKA